MQTQSATSSGYASAASLASLYTRRTIHFVGRVQGVGFRYTARSVALQHDVTGYVRTWQTGGSNSCSKAPRPRSGASLTNSTAR
jgi:hypothetical protein